MANDELKNKPKRIRNIKAARRLLSNLIYEIQTEGVKSEKAKLLIYALIKYSELYKTEKLEEIEKRLKSLEEKQNEKFR